MDDLLLRAAAAAVQQRAHEVRLLGAPIGRLGVLQTGTGDLRDQPHVQ